MPCLQNLFAEENKTPAKVSDRVKYLLHHASLAPSGHNSQPWKIKIISENEWIIGWDKSRSLPAVDPYNRELLLSIGAFCEALSIAAKSIGLEAVKRVTAKDSFSDKLVKVTFRDSVKDNSLLDPLTKRRTVKNGYIPMEINCKDIQNITEGVKSGTHIFNRGSREGDAIDGAVLESNRIQAWRDEAQSELASWIRWKDSDAEKYRNGLTPAGMEMNLFASLYVKHFFNRDDVMSESFRNQTVKITEKYLSSYGSWIILSSGKTNPETLINTGVDFLKMGLNAYNKNIALHPMTQPLEENGFGPYLKKALGIKDEIQFIIRAGYVENYPQPVSLRMPVEKILY